MKKLEHKLEIIQDNILDLAHIVKIQVQKTKQVVFYYEEDLAFEVVKNYNRIEIHKLQIEMDCKNFLALYTPVAVDLRLILAAFKIVDSLEKIGLHTRNICGTLMDLNVQIDLVLLEEFKVNKMLNGIINMLYDIQKAFELNDPQLADKTYKKDKAINKLKLKSPQLAISWLEKYPNDVKYVISVLDIISNVERIGDLIKNFSEGIIFHHEAKVIKESKDLENNIE